MIPCHAHHSRAAVVDLSFRAGSTFPVPVCTVPSSMDRTSRCNKVEAVKLYASYKLNLLLLKGQRCLVRVLTLQLKSKFNLKSDSVNLVAPASSFECQLYLANVRKIQYKLGPERLTRLGNSNVLRRPVL